jgi:hypothetical protein
MSGLGETLYPEVMYSFDVEVAYAIIRVDGISGSVSYLMCVLHGPETSGESPGSSRRK